MIKFSKKEDYALILLTRLFLGYKKRVIPLSEIAKGYKISLPLLRNLAFELSSKNIISAKEGKGGGYFLAKDPKKIKIGEVLFLFSKKPMLECCPSSLLKSKTKCSREAFCKPKNTWQKINREFLDKIENLTLYQFINYK